MNIYIYIYIYVQYEYTYELQCVHIYIYMICLCVWLAAKHYGTYWQFNQPNEDYLDRLINPKQKMVKQ